MGGSAARGSAVRGSAVRGSGGRVGYDADTRSNAPPRAEVGIGGSITRASLLMSTLASPPYQKLDAWQACHDLAVAVYRSTRRWPFGERYGLVAQVRRAAVSAAANLVEGTARRGTREFRRFTDISLGSLSEVDYLLTLAHDVGVIDNEEERLLRELVRRAGQLTGGLHRALRNRRS